MLKFYCIRCEEHQEVIEPILLRSDEFNETPWSDIVCVVCCFVIATVSADEPGKLTLDNYDDMLPEAEVTFVLSHKNEW